MMHKTVYPICKEFLGLLPKQAYKSHLHIIILHTAFERFNLQAKGKKNTWQ